MLSFELLSINLYIDLLNYLHLGCSLKGRNPIGAIPNYVSCDFLIAVTYADTDSPKAYVLPLEFVKNI
jgi:hypothetical protein